MRTVTIRNFPVNELADAFVQVDSAKIDLDGREMQLVVYDATGSMNACWEADRELPDPGSVVKLRGVAEYRGNTELLHIQQLRGVQPSDDLGGAALLARSISELQPGWYFSGPILVRSAETRVGKNGKSYVDLNLADATGEVNSKLWNSEAQAPKSGTVLELKGRAESFQGRVQLRVEGIREVSRADVDMRRLVASAPLPPEEMLQTIRQTVDSFRSEKLRRLVQELLRMAGDRLSWFPAAQRMHHAEKSGLLHHTTDMLKLAEKLLSCYPYLNRDLLLAGVVIHDLGKLWELDSDELGSVSDYTRDGILVGHLVRGVALIELAAEHTNIRGEVVELLQHMVISHHGVPEYGSPRYPQTPEAEALHWLDTLDARMNELEGIQRRTPEGAFSEPIRSLDGRRMYHPRYTEDAE